MVAISLAVISSSCGENGTTQPTPPASIPPSVVPTTMPSTPEPSISESVPPAQAQVRYAFTHVSPDGNRLVGGHGRFPQVGRLTIKLNGIPAWVVGTDTGDGVLWVVALEDGRIEAFAVSGDSVGPAVVIPDRLPPGMPPALKVENGEAKLIVAQSDSASTLTHAMPLDDSGRVAFIDESGTLIISNGDVTASLDVNAPADARILTYGNGDLLVLADQTLEYEHGALGDKVEGGSIVLVSDTGSSPKFRKIELPPGDVVEGLSPIWADVNGDGRRDIVVTMSNSEQGARIVVFDRDGTLLGNGEPIGRGYRWRHQIAVGQFGSDGETEIAVVRTPHIGGVVEFYRMTEKGLEIVASTAGLTSHIFGTRNLDMAIAGDFDSNGQHELIVPSQDRTTLFGISRVSAAPDAIDAISGTQNGIRVAYSLPIDGRVVTNIAAARTDDGSITIALGTEDGLLQIWGPE